MRVFPLWKAARNYQEYSGGVVPALAVALWLWHCGTRSQLGCEASQCGSNLPLALLS